MALYRRLSRNRHVFRRHAISALYSSGDLINPNATVVYSPFINPLQFSSSDDHNHTLNSRKLLTLYPSHSSRIELSGFRQVLHFSTLADSEEEKKNEQQRPSWVDTYLPQKIRPYAHLARLDKPIGTWLLAWPCMW